MNMKLSDIELGFTIISELEKVPKESWDKAIQEVEKEIEIENGGLNIDV